ncbi:MAG: HAMP domain-containing histidine kinase, partial [Anaerolineales bacterium]|nr:HAMP domain-containing histidine kinase [Anaerolineales bacterium]
MRSLTLKLTLAFLLVGVLGAGFVALLINWQTGQEFDAYVQDLYQDDLQNLADRLALHYAAYRSWDGINAVLIREQPEQETRHGRRWLAVTLVDAARTVVYGSRQYQNGQTLAPQLVSRGMPIAVDGQTVGWLLLDKANARESAPDALPPGDAPAAVSPESSFLASVNQATLLSALGASAAALLLGVFLARTISNPVGDLTRATAIVAGGELGYQVPVRTRDELGRLAAAFNHMSADLARANQQRRQMTADIAHDLRTPMSVILGYAEAFSDGTLPGTPEMYGVLYQEARLLSRLIEDLRTLSLADAGELPLVKRPFSPRDLLDHTARAYGVQAQQQGVRLEVAAAADLPDVTADADRLGQVLGNLVSNALRYTPAGGRVTLAAAASGDDLQLVVSDTGRGIPP